MTWLLVKDYKEYSVYSPNTYGVESWGENSQYSIIKKRKYWYIDCWKAGNDWVDDYTEDIKLNVVFETDSGKLLLEEIQKRDVSQYGKIKEQMFQIYIEYNEHQNWINKVTKEHRTKINELTKSPQEFY